MYAIFVSLQLIVQEYGVWRKTCRSTDTLESFVYVYVCVCVCVCFERQSFSISRQDKHDLS